MQKNTKNNNNLPSSVYSSKKGKKKKQNKQNNISPSPNNFLFKPSIIPEKNELFYNQIPLNNIQKNKGTNNSINNYYLDEKNNSQFKAYNHPLNETKDYPEKKSNNKLNKLMIQPIESFYFIFNSKNSYKKSRGKINIKNFFIYDIYDMNKINPQRMKTNDIITIISQNKPKNKNINKPDNNIEKLNNKNYINEKNNSKLNKYINDIYYNKKEGLTNFGNFCYFNSFIQILIHIPGLIQRLKIFKEVIDKKSLLYHLINLADKSSNDNLYYLLISFIQRNSRYKYGEQNDSQEFGAEFLKAINNELSILRYFIAEWRIQDGFNLKNINNEMIKQKIDKLNNLLNDANNEFRYQTLINYFLYYYETKCIVCNNKIMNYNYYGDLDIQLPFDMNNNYYSVNLIDMLKKKYIYGKSKLIKLPIIFNITLLRAVINKPLITTKINIAYDIDFQDFLDKDFGDYSLSTKYTLYALNICIGSIKRSGHYYSYILINNEWYKFDDSRVTKVNENIIIEDLSYVYGIYYINKDYLKSLYSINNYNK